MLYPIERILREWSLYYNESEDDIDREANENCVKISFSKDDIRVLRKSDLNQLLVNLEKFFSIKVKKSGRSMVFYLWVDGMIPAIKFSLVSPLYNKLPFSVSYTEIRDKNLAVNEVFDKLKLMSEPLDMENPKPCNDNRDKVVYKKRNKNKLLVYSKLLDS